MWFQQTRNNYRHTSGVTGWSSSKTDLASVARLLRWAVFSRSTFKRAKQSGLQNSGKEKVVVWCCAHTPQRHHCTHPENCQIVPRCRKNSQQQTSSTLSGGAQTPEEGKQIVWSLGISCQMSQLNNAARCLIYYSVYYFSGTNRSMNNVLTTVCTNCWETFGYKQGSHTESLEGNHFHPVSSPQL